MIRLFLVQLGAVQWFFWHSLTLIYKVDGPSCPAAIPKLVIVLSDLRREVLRVILVVHKSPLLNILSNPWPSEPLPRDWIEL